MNCCVDLNVPSLNILHHGIHTTPEKQNRSFISAPLEFLFFVNDFSARFKMLFFFALRKKKEVLQIYDLIFERIWDGLPLLFPLSVSPKILYPLKTLLEVLIVSLYVPLFLLFWPFTAQPEQWQMKCKLVVGAESARMYLTPRQRHKLEMNSLEVCVLNHFE